MSVVVPAKVGPFDLGEVVAAAADRAHDLVDVDRLALAVALGHGHGGATGLRRGQAEVVLGGRGRTRRGALHRGGFDLHGRFDSHEGEGVRPGMGNRGDGCGEVARTCRKGAGNRPLKGPSDGEITAGITLP